jgi:enterochelin esterase-like enzyme
MKSLSSFSKRAALMFACFAVARAFAARFDIALPADDTNRYDGRLLLILGTTNNVEPRFAIDDADAHGPFVFGNDVNRLTRRPYVIDESATATLDMKLWLLPAGRYYAQAVLDVSTDMRGVNVAGNRISDVKEVEWNPKSSRTIKLALTHVLADEQPAETDLVKFVKIQSKLLTEFHHRPVFLRAGIVLPTSYAQETQRHYPLWIHVGGFGARYTRVAEMMKTGSHFQQTWTAKDAPQMFYVLLDGVGPNGDPYQINSANNGPYGDAIVTELIPHLEREFRTTGGQHGRILTGKSTGGWASLALQIFYPDFFGGVWSACPDSVDFRSFELVNLYADENAFVNHHGEERPSAREVNGDVRLLMRREVQMESVLGRAGQWTRSGGQWGAWNAVYGPRGADGLPVPVWDAKGRINPAVARQWAKYDLRLVLETNWDTLAPKLRGKIHIAVGEADDYFLNNAVHLLDEALSARTPKDVVSFSYGAREGHGWTGMGLVDLMKQVYGATQVKE